MHLRKMYFAITLIAASILLAACNTFPSTNKDPQRNNKEAFRKDLAECKEDHPESSAGLHYKRWVDCMQLKGWE